MEKCSSTIIPLKSFLRYWCWKEEKYFGIGTLVSLMVQPTKFKPSLSQVSIQKLRSCLCIHLNMGHFCTSHSLGYCNRRWLSDSDFEPASVKKLGSYLCISLYNSLFTYFCYLSLIFEISWLRYLISQASITL